MGNILFTCGIEQRLIVIERNAEVKVIEYVVKVIRGAGTYAVMHIF